MAAAVQGRGCGGHLILQRAASLKRLHDRQNVMMYNSLPLKTSRR